MCENPSANIYKQRSSIVTKLCCERKLSFQRKKEKNLGFENKEGNEAFTKHFSFILREI